MYACVTIYMNACFQARVCVFACVHACMCACMRVRETENEREMEKEIQETINLHQSNLKVEIYVLVLQENVLGKT